MAWLIMALRRSELTHSYNDHVYENLKISRDLRKLNNFSSSIAEGRVNPSAVASLGTELFGDAMDCMLYGNDAATQIATEQTDYYLQAYEGITQEQYYNNPAIASQASLYYNADGTFNEEKMYAEFYEEALKEFVQEVIMPELNEKEKELEEEKNRIETLMASEEAELQELKNSVKTEIQNTTIQLS